MVITYQKNEKNYANLVWFLYANWRGYAAMLSADGYPCQGWKFHKPIDKVIKAQFRQLSLPHPAYLRKLEQIVTLPLGVWLGLRPHLNFKLYLNIVKPFHIGS